MILQGKVYIESWFDNLPKDQRFEVSNNGWTLYEIGLRWLQNLFITLTNLRVHGRYLLLIFDGHGSHLTPHLRPNLRRKRCYTALYTCAFFASTTVA